MAYKLDAPMTPEERARTLALNRGRREAEQSVRALTRSIARPETQTGRLRQAIEEKHIDRYTQAEEDVADENALPGGIVLSVAWLVAQIDRAFANAAIAPTVDPRYLARQIYGLHDEELGTDLCLLGPAEIDVNRVIGHIEQLGLRLPNRVAGTIARRIFLAVVNRNVPPPVPVGEAESTEFCPQCGASVRKGEACSCPS